MSYRTSNRTKMRSNRRRFSTRARALLACLGLFLAGAVFGGVARAQQPAPADAKGAASGDGAAGNASSGPVAGTEEGKQEAASRYARGMELFQEGNYRAALIEFDRAYELAPNWRVLFNIAQVQYQLQDYPRALTTFERYLREGGPNIPEDRRKIVEADIERLRPRVSYLKIVVNVPEAEIAIDDVTMGTSPVAEAIAVGAGRRKIVVSKPGLVPITKMVDIAGGDTQEVDITLVDPTVAKPQPDPKPDETPKSTTPKPEEEAGVPWGAWAAAGGLGAAAVVFGLLAVSASGDLSDAKARVTSVEELNQVRDRTLVLSVVTDVFIAGTAVAGGVALYLTLADGDDDAGADAGVVADTRGTELKLGFTPGGVSLLGTF